jgi:formate hydrogenlyase subunit 6/NADH:ubiquinone oxidoreductase subunit I
MSMTPVQTLYCRFCEHIADLCEEQATMYERHPELDSEDRQFANVLRDKSKEWRNQTQRIESAYPIRGIPGRELA